VAELTATPLTGPSSAAGVLIVGPSLGTSVEALWTRCSAMLPFEVVGWDLPGHGRSGPAAKAFSVPVLADAVRRLAQAVAGGRDTWYGGVSLGGAVGLELALDPGPFGAVAMVASAPKIGDAESWRERADLVRREGTEVMMAGSAERWFAPGFTAREPAIAGALLTSLSKTDRESYALACEALASFDLRDRLGARKVPLLIAAGQHDPVVSPEQARSVAADAFAVIPGCGHLPPAEAPAAVAESLASFFKSAKDGVDSATGRNLTQRFQGVVPLAPAAPRPLVPSLRRDQLLRHPRTAPGWMSTASPARSPPGCRCCLPGSATSTPSRPAGTRERSPSCSRWPRAARGGRSPSVQHSGPPAT
jgi:pimeloyl-ACP methyl ester carboxylesterase